MDYPAFRSTLSDATPPESLTPAFRALWQDARGHWAKAHEIAQDIEGPEGAWIHAYLHRKEGDAGNAAYWYRRAGKPVCRETLEAEWEAIARAMTEAARAGGGD